MGPAPWRDFALLRFCLSFSFLCFFFFFTRRICDEGMVQNRNKWVLIKEKGAEGFGHGLNEGGGGCAGKHMKQDSRLLGFPEKMYKIVAPNFFSQNQNWFTHCFKIHLSFFFFNI